VRTKVFFLVLLVGDDNGNVVERKIFAFDNRSQGQASPVILSGFQASLFMSVKNLFVILFLLVEQT
jgi:hypothetical protein